MTVVRWLTAGTSHTLTSAPALSMERRYGWIWPSGAAWSRRELEKTKRQPSRGPKSGHWSAVHACSSRGSDHPRLSCSSRRSVIVHMPRARLPPVLNTPQRNSGISRPTQL
jgi:hypothetical protein